MDEEDVVESRTRMAEPPILATGPREPVRARKELALTSLRPCGRRATASMPDSSSTTTTPAATVLTTADPVLGSGRSGVVFKSEDARGRITARKVFDSDALTRAVQYLFLGAPNPYAWSEHAIQSAMLRRRILAPLVRHWLGDLLRVGDDSHS